jgi:hypothetical protein
MRVRERVFAWVVYERHIAGRPKLTLVCPQPEWDAMELVQPNPNVLIQAGITNEGEAERLARSGAVVAKVKVVRPRPLTTVAVDAAKPGPNLRHDAMGQFWKQVNQFSSQSSGDPPRVGG